ncbi:hypothetical protein GYB22_10365 [bacterium]|nr:hypothetical protein [bacterium]
MCCISTVHVGAQTGYLESARFGLELKSHRFYDRDVYRISDANDAVLRGIGLSYQSTWGKRFIPIASYQIGLSNGISNKNGETNRLFYHQLDFNVGLKLFHEPTVYQSFIYLGYGLDKLEGKQRLGVHSNFGLGINYQVLPRLVLTYRADFALHHGSDYLHNFRSQIGLSISDVFNSNRLNEQRQSEANYLCDSLMLAQRDSFRQIESNKDSVLSAFIDQSEKMSKSLIYENAVLDHKNTKQEQIINTILEDASYFIRDTILPDSIMSVFSELSLYDRTGYYAYLSRIDSSSLDSISGSIMRNCEKCICYQYADRNSKLVYYLGTEPSSALTKFLDLYRRYPQTRIFLIK